MKKLLSIFAIALVVVLLAISACQTATGEADDIVSSPGGPVYRANFHQQGVKNPWPPIETSEAVLGDGAYVTYRDYIETKAGETRNNIFYIRIPHKNIRYATLEFSNIPTGMKIRVGTKWHGPGRIATGLVIEISQQVKLGKHDFDVSVIIDGKDYGKVPCTIEVLE